VENEGESVKTAEVWDVEGHNCEEGFKERGVIDWAKKLLKCEVIN
jgi:hypothetical protein